MIWILKSGSSLQNNSLIITGQSCLQWSVYPPLEAFDSADSSYCLWSQPKPILDNGNGLQFGLHRKISMETARSWLHRLGFHNFKDYRGTAKKGKPNPPDALSTGKESIQERENGFKT